MQGAITLLSGSNDKANRGLSWARVERHVVRIGWRYIKGLLQFRLLFVIGYIKHPHISITIIIKNDTTVFWRVYFGQVGNPKIKNKNHHLGGIFFVWHSKLPLKKYFAAGDVSRKMMISFFHLFFYLQNFVFRVNLGVQINPPVRWDIISLKQMCAIRNYSAISIIAPLYKISLTP